MLVAGTGNPSTTAITNMKVRWCRGESTNPGMIDPYGTNWRTDQSAQGTQGYPAGGQQAGADHCRVPYCGLQCDRPSLDHFTLRALWSARRRIYYFLTPSNTLSRAS